MGGGKKVAGKQIEARGGSRCKKDRHGKLHFLKNQRKEFNSRAKQEHEFRKRGRKGTQQ